MAKNIFMFSDEVQGLFNDLIREEFTAERHYIQAHIYCQNAGLTIAADYFLKESASEREHAQKLINYFTDWGVVPNLPFIPEGKASFKNLHEVIYTSLNGLELPLYVKYGEVYSKIEEEYPQCAKFLLEFMQIQHDSVAEYKTMLDTLDGIDVNDKYQMVTLQSVLFK